ncbi:MAG: hypothetical protein NT116_02160 [Candidatus Parcubacteria bacterium]|nr:hypothetical protein [Candidatus Parcubacteria bacterium]
MAMADTLFPSESCKIIETPLKPASAKAAIGKIKLIPRMRIIPQKMEKFLNLFLIILFISY